MPAFTVYVYNDHRRTRKRVHVNRPLAYLRYQGEGACLHFSGQAENGAEAKRHAIEQHLSMADCLQADPHCQRCPGLGADVRKGARP